MLGSTSQRIGTVAPVWDGVPPSWKGEVLFLELFALFGRQLRHLPTLLLRKRGSLVLHRGILLARSLLTAFR